MDSVRSPKQRSQLPYRCYSDPVPVRFSTQLLHRDRIHNFVPDLLLENISSLSAGKHQKQENLLLQESDNGCRRIILHRDSDNHKSCDPGNPLPE